MLHLVTSCIRGESWRCLFGGGRIRKKKYKSGLPNERDCPCLPRLREYEGLAGVDSIISCLLKGNGEGKDVLAHGISLLLN